MILEDATPSPMAELSQSTMRMSGAVRSLFLGQRRTHAATSKRITAGLPYTITQLFPHVAMHHSLTLFCDYCLVARKA
jgi:hypothetical protein